MWRAIADLLRNPASRDFMRAGVNIVNILLRQKRLTTDNVDVVLVLMSPLRKLAESDIPVEDVVAGFVCLEQILNQPDGLAKLQALVDSS